MRISIVLAVALASGTAFAEGAIEVPWQEVRDLLTSTVEREIRDEFAEPEKEAQVYSIDVARYQLAVSEADTRGEVTLEGRVVAGDPEPIPLFGPDLVITELKQVSGGAVFLAKESARVHFLPDADAETFEITVGLLLQPTEENGTQSIAFEAPAALTNTLSLMLPPDSRLLAHPGILDSGGSYRFAAVPAVTIKYLDSQTAAIAASIEVDTASRVTVQKQRVCVNTHFQPVRGVAGPLILHAPQGAEFLSASLNASRIKRVEGERYEIDVPMDQSAPFSIEFGIPTPEGSGDISFLLPVIEKNLGQQGRFVLDEPEGMQVTVTAPGLVSQIPVERLGSILGTRVEDAHSFMSVSPESPISLSVKRFTAISAPATVLECQNFFASIEENGDILSVLSLDVPPEFGARLALKAVEDGRIWSIMVNDARKDAYEGEPGTWIIPLDGRETSHVELAFLRSGPKLGLQGTLDVVVPETGLVSQKVHVGVALPERVELLSVEGPVNNASADGRDLPPGIVGRPHFFSRSFYRGEGMTLSIYYKEPLKQTSN